MASGWLRHTKVWFSCSVSDEGGDGDAETQAENKSVLHVSVYVVIDRNSIKTVLGNKSHQSSLRKVTIISLLSLHNTVSPFL